MATITMILKNNCDFENADDTTKVKFINVDEPLTADELARYFIRFANACGFSEMNIAESMIGVGEEMIPPNKV
jgi:hypothetical protein